MKATIIEKGKKIIENRHFEADNIAINNKVKALEDEKFKKLYNEYVQTMIDNAKNGKDDNLTIDRLLKEIDKRLKELNIGSILPDYTCKKCNDNGFINGQYCDCLIDEVNKILISESGFLKLEDFETTNFNIFTENQEIMIKLYDKMKKWCHSDFDKNLIFLAGQTGVGKTHLIKCMANELIKRHKVILLTTSFAMHQDFIKSYSCRDLEEKQNLLNRYLDAEILFIDDLGTELRQPNITVGYLYQILNERKMKRRPTIITSNLQLSDIIDYYDERISSRIADKATSICIYLEGEDLRMKK